VARPAGFEEPKMRKSKTSSTVLFSAGVLIVCSAVLLIWNRGAGNDTTEVELVSLNPDRVDEIKAGHATAALKRSTTPIHSIHSRRGSKYSQELEALAKRAEPDRKEALAKLEALRRRSEGRQSHGAAGKHKIPAALLEMENLARRKTPSAVDGLGKLARSHGIESSKKMLAEIMSLRHYKKSNSEINDIANGFEAHSSISHRFKKPIDAHVAAANAEKERVKKAKAAAALRLEAGRVTMKEMKRSISSDVERSVGKALEHTFQPIQRMLRTDETKIDAMVKPGLHHAESSGAADDAAQSLRHDLMKEMKSEVKRVLSAKEIALEHKMPSYLEQVHAKAMQTLNTVVNPDRIRIDSAAPVLPVAGTDDKSAAKGPDAITWSSKVANFLRSTEKFIRSQQDNIATRPLAFNTAIKATQGELERQLKSVTLSAKVPTKPKSTHTASSSSPTSAASAKRPATESSAQKAMSPQQKSAFKKALDSYL
jgi:hypothetical protein